MENEIIKLLEDIENPRILRLIYAYIKALIDNSKAS